MIKLKIMNEYDIKRLIEMEAIKVEIEAMKVVNNDRKLLKDISFYKADDFNAKAEELRILASKHNEQL